MAAAWLLASAPAFAQSEQPAAQLSAPADDGPQQVTIEGHYGNAVGTSDAASEGVIRAELLKSRPALRPGEVLEFVPGVIVTQHSGDGKANQYFLRGFNLDHGTDFATTVDGLPVNMPTHAHGHGYSDLNFLIPELVERIEYRKGPYFARNGDFSAAGSADIVYRRSLAQPLAQLTLGEHGYERLVAAGSVAAAAGADSVTGALELMRNDGPWTLPEGLQKTNALLAWHRGDASSGASAELMGYEARWRATDQVPQRAIASGLIGRFDAIDPTDGGSTSRASLSAEAHGSEADGRWRANAYAIRYRLDLFSDFTYALDRPAQGDQFEQSDARSVFGGAVSRTWTHEWLGRPASAEIGLQLRQDRIRVGLFDTVARQRTGTTRDDQVRETAAGLYAEESVAWTPWLRSVAGVRWDEDSFSVDSLLAANSGRARASQGSPKLALVLGPWARTELFVDAGRGFHSNDARGVTAHADPRTGEPLQPVPALVSSTGWEIGLRTEAVAGLQSSLALWTLRSGSELVYVGDEGTTEPNRPSLRRGVEWNNRWIPYRWLLVDADLAWTRARFSQPDPAGPFIPGAVPRVASAAVTLRDIEGWSSSLQARFLGAHPLVEDASVSAASTLLLNLRVARKLSAQADLTLDVFNLADRRANDIEYWYESRLPGEPSAVADRHLHPAEPRTARLTLQYRF